MPALTPQFLFDFESNMQAIVENEMARVTQQLWVDQVVKFLPSASKREILAWILDSAQLSDMGVMGGNMSFADMVVLNTEVTNRFSGQGLRLRRAQFEDNDEHGIELGAKWAGEMGALFSYFPQQAASELILTGESATGYDGQAFFSKAHPNNPKMPSAGTYGNLFSGAYNGSSNPTFYAAPLSGVTLDVALANLWRVYTTIRSFKMPNGKTPRMLRPTKMLVPSALFPQAVEITNARFMAQATSATGGGSADVSAVITALGFTQPVEIPEFAGIDNTSWYLLCEEMATSQLGAIVHTQREPYAIRYYSGMGGNGAPDGLDAILGRADELEWQALGRNGTQFGHPYLLIKVKAS